MHFFAQSSSFRNTCPYYRSLFCFNTNVMSIPNLSLSSLIGNLSSSYIHLTILISARWSASSFSFSQSLQPNVIWLVGVGLPAASASHHPAWLSSWSVGYGSGCRGQRADFTENRRRDTESVWSLRCIAGNYWYWVTFFVKKGTPYSITTRSYPHNP